MHPFERYKQQYAHIRPIVILAPIQRCGSTLLQRLINAGGEAIIYGENFYLSEVLPRNVVDIAGNIEQKASITAPTMEKFLGGDRGMDATTLFPDYPKYSELVIKSFYELLDLYQQESESKGVRHWGIKYQMRDPVGAIDFLFLLPNVRLITITRNLMDVAKSFFARWPEQLPNEHAFAALGQRWKVHNDYLKQIRIPHLAIQYESFMADKKGYVERLENATEVAIGGEELNRKININASDPAVKKAERKASGHYLAPKELPSYATEVLQRFSAA